MKEKYVKIVNLIVAVLVALFCIGQVFAWFADRKYEDEANFGGSSAGAYFARGDGSFENPFVINKPNHLYNLAWLQNTGRFDKQYYFELDPDMEGPLTLADDFWLPPIGNEENPFEGVFDGRGKTISNLRITTDKAKLYMNPFGGDDESYEFSQAVGFFGNTSGEDCAVKNFILDNPLVQVSSVNTKYSAEGNKAVGIAVGHVEGLCQSIGVYAHGSTATPSEDTLLDVQVTEYNTFNSILGELGAGVTSSVTGGGHGAGGSGNAFGANFDILSLRYRMEKIEANKKSANPSPAWKLPDIDTSTDNEYPVPRALQKVAFSVTDQSTYEGEDAVEVVADNNIGYFLGNQNKIKRKERTFEDKMVLENGTWVKQGEDLPKWFYKFTTESGSYDTMGQVPSYSSNVFNPLTQEEYDALPEGIKDLLTPDSVSQNGDKIVEKRNYYVTRLSQTFNNTEHPFYNNDLGGWSFHGQISYMGKTYGKGFMDENVMAVDENGEATGDMLNQYGQKTNFYEYTGGIYMPNNAIWFKPSQVGKIRFVMFAEKEEGFALIKITRNGATRENPFYTAPNVGSWGYGEDIDFEPLIRTTLPVDVLLYYEYDIPKEDIEAGNVEYMLMQYAKNGAYFVYLDIGASADDNSAVVPDVVSAVDFIYEGVEIAQDKEEGSDFSVGDFIVQSKTDKDKHTRYNATRTSVYFENISLALQVAFVRVGDEGSAYTLRVVRSSEQVTANNVNLVEWTDTPSIAVPGLSG